MKVRNLIEKIILVSLLVATLLYAFNARNKDFSNKGEEKVIINEIMNLSKKSMDDIRDVIGKEKSVHRDKVYTYEDSLARYDLLVVDEIQNMVVTLKEAKSKEAVYDMLSIRADMILDKELQDENHYRIIDKENNMEFILMGDKEGNVSKLKVLYN